MKKIIKNKTNLRLVSDGNISRYSYNVFDIGGIKDSINKLDSFLKDSDNIDKIESGLGAATSIINAGLSNAKVADTSNIENAIRDFTNTPIERSSREALSNQWVNTVNPRDNYEGSDFTQSTGSQIGNTLGAAFSGALSGSKLGGLPGAIGGAIIGLGSGITGAIIGNNRAKKKADRLNRLATNAAQIRQGNYYASADYLDDIDMFNYLSNYKALGGYMDNLFSRGGYLGHTHGGMFDNGVTFINEGGSHEDNPYGGVQSGVDNEGNPNLVEEGEVLYNDYVFSNRLYATDKQLEEYGLPKRYANWTFARIANELSKESEERMYDPISKNGLEDSMGKLMSLQESIRQTDNNSNVFAEGGDKNDESQDNTQDILAEAEEYADKHSGAKRGTPRWNEVRDQRLQKLNYKKQTEARKAEAVQLMKDSRRAAYDFLVDRGYSLPPYTEDFNISGLDKYSQQDIKDYGDIATGKVKYNRVKSNSDGLIEPSQSESLVKDGAINNDEKSDLKPKPRIKSSSQSAKKESNEPTTSDIKPRTGWIGDPAGFNRFNPDYVDLNKVLDDQLAIGAIRQGEGMGLIDNRGQVALPDTAEEPVSNDNSAYNTALRYAPILGNLLAYLGNSKDYSDVENFMQETANPRSVAFTPLGNYIRPEYISPWELSNPIERQASSTRGYLMNNAGNNRAAANAALVASDYNTLGLLGQALLQGKQYNNQQRIQAADFNRATDQYNSQGAMQAQASNMSLNQYGLQRALSEYQMRNNIDNAYNQARSQNITSLYDNLANVGRENFIMNQLNSNKALLYGLNRLGLSKYVG